MKKVVKIIKGVVGCLVIIGAILVIDEVLTYALVDDAASETRYILKNFYEQEDIETLFIGSSHVYSGYVPSILDEKLEENTYLLATPLQQTDGSYYLLKEAIKSNDLKKVYVDVYVRQYQGSPEKRSDFQMSYVYCISDYMKNSFERVEYLVNASGPERYLDSFLVSSRYGNELLNFERLTGIIESKRSDSYKNDIPAEKAGRIFDKGAWLETGQKGTPDMITTPAEYEYGPISKEVISDYSLRYLDKMVELCKKEGIELILITTPFSNYYIESVGNYTQFCDYMKMYAEKNDVEFYDFNLCKIEYLDLQDEDFVDVHHLSGVGAEKYSRVFANIMKDYGREERQKLFYQSVEEKMEALPKQTFGVTLAELDFRMFEVGISANYEPDVEYRISIIDGFNNESEILQEFQQNSVLDLRSYESNYYRIMVRDIVTNEILEDVQVRL